MNVFRNLLDHTTSLVKDPFNTDNLKNQIVPWRSGSTDATGPIQRAPITSNDPTKAGSASDKMAQLTRAQWDDYVNRFQPYDKALIGLATSDTDNQAAIDSAKMGVSSAFDVSQGTLQRNNQRLGLSAAADVSALNQRDSQARETASQVNVMNNIRIAAKDRDNEIMSGSGGARTSILPQNQGA